MPPVEFPALGIDAESKPGETLLDVARRAGAPLGNSCGGIGICARCRVIVLENEEALTPPTSVEIRVARERSLTTRERLACQAVVLGRCSVTTAYW